MRTRLASLFLIFMVVPTYAGQWQKLSQDTLLFTGKIDAGEYRRFNSVFTPEIKNIVIDARGGPIAEGLRIGFVLLRHDITAIVKGVCTSSCANYIFLAAKRRIIDGGIVGFHGNATAYHNQIGAQDDPARAILLGTRADQVNPEYIDDRNLGRAEELFFASVGPEIQQEFFDRTQREAEVEKLYYYLLPTAETFKKYGFTNIEGEQNLDLIANDPRIKALPRPVLVE